MPSETDAASEPVAEVEFFNKRYARINVDIEKLIDLQLGKGRDVRIGPEGAITFFYKRHGGCRASRKGPSDDKSRRCESKTGGTKTAKQLRDECRNTRERFEERVLKRLEKAKMQRHTAAITTDATAGQVEPQAAPPVEVADVGMEQAVPERRGVRDDAMTCKRRVVTSATADAVERTAEVAEKVATMAAARGVAKQMKPQARILAVGAHPITKKGKQRDNPTHGENIYKQLTRGERMLIATHETR